MEIQVAARVKFKHDGVEVPVIGHSDDVVWAVKATLNIAADMDRIVCCYMVA